MEIKNKQDICLLYALQKLLKSNPEIFGLLTQENDKIVSEFMRSDFNQLPQNTYVMVELTDVLSKPHSTQNTFKTFKEVEEETKRYLANQLDEHERHAAVDICSLVIEKTVTLGLHELEI